MVLRRFCPCLESPLLEKYETGLSSEPGLELGRYKQTKQLRAIQQRFCPIICHSVRIHFVKLLFIWGPNTSRRSGGTYLLLLMKNSISEFLQWNALRVDFREDSVRNGWPVVRWLPLTARILLPSITGVIGLHIESNSFLSLPQQLQAKCADLQAKCTEAKKTLTEVILGFLCTDSCWMVLEKFCVRCTKWWRCLTTHWSCGVGRRSTVSGFVWRCISIYH